ncbi:unnamed protein product [Malus baccata var. baccata]
MEEAEADIVKRALSHPLKLIAKSDVVNGSIVSEKAFFFIEEGEDHRGGILGRLVGLWGVGSGWFRFDRGHGSMESRLRMRKLCRRWRHRYYFSGSSCYMMVDEEFEMLSALSVRDEDMIMIVSNSASSQSKSSSRRGQQVLHMYNMKMKLVMRILLLCFLSCFWFQLSFAQNAITDPSEVRALNSIFEQWDTQAVSGLWNISGEPCSGSALNGTDFESPNDNPDINPAIECDCTYDNGTTCHITKLRAYALNKRGVFSEEFVALRYLITLRIVRNYFTGPLLAFIGNMSALTVLYIRFNSFSGPIPKELGNLKELTVLLRMRKLSRWSAVRALNSIFEQWDTQAVSGLWNISGEPCSGSALNGTDFESPNDNPDINPAIECDCTYDNGTTCHITKLRVYALNKRGVFPEEFVALRYLTTLRIDRNYFTGPLPAFIGNMSALTVLYIRFNSFSGPIPKELGNLKELTVLDIGSNNFSGTLPPELGNLVKLEQLYLDSCGLGGEIPSTFANLTNMQILSATNSPFSGKIPDFIGNWTQLTDLRFEGNSFEGPIPTSFSQLTSLLSLGITDIYNGSSSLDFIKNLKKLTNLELRNALIIGTIPSDIGEYQSLQKLDLSFNNLTGQLPSSLFTMSSLTSLFLGNNSLSGPLPSQKSFQLMTIDLSYNFLSGNLPQWVTTMSQQLNLVVNNFTFDSSNRARRGLNCLQRNFPCNRNPPRYANFSINCGGPEMLGSDGILYEGEDSALGPATFSVTSTLKWAVSNAGLFYIGNPSFLENTLEQVTGTDVTPELFQTSRVSAGSLRYYGLGLENGPYTVTLHFAETVYESRTSQTWQSLGRRVFDIYIQGTRRTKDFDISNEVGGVNRAVVRRFNVSVSENYLEIHLFWTGKGTCCIPDYGDYGPLIVAVHAASDILGLGPRPNTFSYAELRAATEDFNPSNKLGEGGYGPVYKGTLSDGRVVAVKQLSAASHQGKSQFVSEIATISGVQHRNLVKLYGCCIEGSHRILVYEYLENNSLDQALFGTSNLHLDWPTRFNILLGTARGLAYLHEESRPRIVHRDVKASNILLDAKLSPKISDFGLAKLYDDEKTHISTRVAGTIGYVAPEYALFGHLTEKADVFGFGVVVLEILSGRPNSDNNLDPEKIYLLEWVWTLHENDQTLGLVDPRLTEFDETEVTRLIRAALLCTQGSPMARPSMSRVVAMLFGDIDIGTVMSKPNYLTDYNFKDVTTFSTGRFLVDDDTPSTASKHSNVRLNYQPEGSNASGANTLGVDPAPSPVNVTQSLLAGIIGEGRAGKKSQKSQTKPKKSRSQTKIPEIFGISSVHLFRSAALTLSLRSSPTSSVPHQTVEFRPATGPPLHHTLVSDSPAFLHHTTTTLSRDLSLSHGHRTALIRGFSLTDRTGDLSHGLTWFSEIRECHAAAFGDDIAIECLATEFKREIYVAKPVFCAFDHFSIALRQHRDTGKFKHMVQMRWLMKRIVFSSFPTDQGVKGTVGVVPELLAGLVDHRAGRINQV